MARLLLWIVVLMSDLVVFAQQYRMDHFGIGDGLSQNTVNCILRDSEGYYWFGTQDGLNRYDGYSVKVFRNEREDTNSICDNFVLQIVEDDWGNLWIGTRNGLTHYSKKTNWFTRAWMDENERKEYHSTTRSLLKNSRGDILFSSGNVTYGSITKEDARIPPFQILDHKDQYLSGDGKFYSIHEKSTQLLTVYAENGQMLGQTKADRKEMHLGRTPIAVWRKRIYFAGAGLWFLNNANDTLQQAFSSLKDKAVGVVYVDQQDRMWIGTNDGLYVLDDEKAGPKFLAHKAENKYSPGSNGVEGIYEDRDGLLWIGTAEGGVNIYDPQKEEFIHLNSRTTPALPSDMVWGAYQGANELFVGTNGGLARFTLKDKDLAGFEKKVLSAEVISEKSVGDKVVTCFAKDTEGRIWIGTRSSGVSVFDPATSKWIHYTKELAVIRQGVVSHILCDRDGDMWISTQAGLYCYKKSSGEFEFHAPAYFKPGGLPSGYIFSASQDKQDFIWVGSSNGLYKYDKMTKKFIIYQSQPGDATGLSYNMPTSTYEDSKGRFWVCTLGGGINLMDREKGTFRSFAKKQGLANDVTYCMLEDSKGFLWISTNAGLSRFDPQKETFENFGMKEGVVSNEFTTNAAFKNEVGQMLFGSPEGAVIFQPERIKTPEHEIPIVLTDLHINYQSVDPVNDIDLHYGDKTIAFEFAAIDWRRQDKISYEFRLDGFDAQWNEVSSSVRIASYSNLPFGDYTFRVHVKEGNGSWQEKQFAVNLHVIPPFWLRTWFIAGEVILGLIVIFLSIQYYSQRKLKTKLREIELQHKIQMERERISRDLHDNVGSNLTYIISSLDTISNRFEQLPTGQAQVKIESLGEFTRSTMQQLRETIWVINKECVTIQELREKIREHVTKMLSVNEGMKFNVEANGNLEIRLTPSVAIHLFRIVQEAVNNCVKHSKAADLVVEINAQESNSVCVVIKDNGKGFDDNQELEGHYGLANMQARTEGIGGKFELRSQMGKGTTVRLVVPVK